MKYLLPIILVFACFIVISDQLGLGSLTDLPKSIGSVSRPPTKKPDKKPEKKKGKETSSSTSEAEEDHNSASKNKDSPKKVKLKQELEVTTAAPSPPPSKSQNDDDDDQGSQKAQEKNSDEMLDGTTENPEIVSPACDPISGEISQMILNLRNRLDSAGISTFVYNYSRGDNYLLRWLVGCSLAVESCEQRILTHVQWRKLIKLDNIDKEDWRGFEKFPLFIDTSDKAGRPVIEWWLTDWDIKGALGDKALGIAKLVKWFTKMMEMVTRRMYELNVLEQRCTTQAVLLVDVENMSEDKHACPPCLQYLAVIAAAYETNYPNLFRNIHFINSGNPVFLKVLKTMVAGFKQRERALGAMKVYKTRDQWTEALNEIISPGNRSPRFGGTKERNHN